MLGVGGYLVLFMFVKWGQTGNCPGRTATWAGNRYFKETLPSISVLTPTRKAS